MSDESRAGEGVLQIVSTPIGHLEDVSLRALRVLGEADCLLAEDTRRIRVLLERHGVEARPISLHAHNEASRIERALDVLAGGGRVVLVSDAGTPLVSDPGERLVGAAIEAGYRVEPVPGPSAVTAALVGSGLAAVPFLFLGFPPRRAGERRRLFETLRSRSETLVWLESPRRLRATLEELASALGERRACVAREMTKLHEEYARGTLSELSERFSGSVRGEITLVVEGAPESERSAIRDDERLEAAVRALLAEGCHPRQVAAGLAAATGRPRREIYAAAVAVRNEGSS